MDFRQQHIRNGYDFAVCHARREAQLGIYPTYWQGQSMGLALWAGAAPEWELTGHTNERRWLLNDYAPRHAA